ncbi:hypothetical protein PsAD5_02647 [Pseudovibrio sp. Ad5]|uniref:hypothetical protein n=1 Tax=Pseudovibrio sp. Ad5 TaxID=989436 RepID=UPI0007AE40C2|nr:hypothetical protein [Pseudovibrio sp. Ad5]KZK96454.1 hypothetical protein PsAD5_02647 [Pseudovibrio sp. Ad5]
MKFLFIALNLFVFWCSSVYAETGKLDLAKQYAEKLNFMQHYRAHTRKELQPLMMEVYSAENLSNVHERVENDLSKIDEQLLSMTDQLHEQIALGFADKLTKEQLKERLSQEVHIEDIAGALNFKWNYDPSEKRFVLSQPGGDPYRLLNSAE